MTRSVYFSLFLIASIFIYTPLYSQESENRNSDFVFDISELPPILLSQTGEKISTQTAWEEQRRPEYHIREGRLAKGD